MMPNPWPIQYECHACGTIIVPPSKPFACVIGEPSPIKRTLRDLIDLLKERGKHGPCPECGALNGEHTDDCQLEVDTELVEEGGGS